MGRRGLAPTPVVLRAARGRKRRARGLAPEREQHKLRELRTGVRGRAPDARRRAGRRHPTHPGGVANGHHPHQHQWVASGRAPPDGRGRTELRADQHLQPRRQAIPRLLPASGLRAGPSRAVRRGGSGGRRPGHDQPLDLPRDQRRAGRAERPGRVRPAAPRAPGAAAQPERRSPLAAGPDSGPDEGHRHAGFCPGAHGPLPGASAREFHPSVAGSRQFELVKSDPRWACFELVADLYSPNDPHMGTADYGHGTNRPVQADIPAQPGTNRGRRSGIVAGILAFLGLVLSKLSYIGLLLLKFKGLWFTVVSTGVTALIYAQLFGWAFGVGIVLLILIHESGHVVVARIMGLPVTLPVMIPFLGAFVSMKQQPRTVAQESIMAIGGPVLGSIAAGLCYLGYLTMPTSSTGQLLRALAYFGFLINLFNLIPLTPLDGGRVTSLLSKWFNVAGLVLAAGLLLFEMQSGTTVSPVLFLVLIFGAFATWQRFRSTTLNPAYYAVGAQTKVAVGALYLGLLFALGVGMLQTAAVLRPSG